MKFWYQRRRRRLKMSISFWRKWVCFDSLHVQGLLYPLRLSGNSLLVFLFYDWFTGWEIGPEQVDIADTLICHARYNQSIFNKHLPADVKWVVPVRDAVSWMKSAVTYWGHRINYTVSCIFKTKCYICWRVIICIQITIIHVLLVKGYRS